MSGLRPFPLNIGSCRTINQPVKFSPGTAPTVFRTTRRKICRRECAARTELPDPSGTKRALTIRSAKSPCNDMGARLAQVFTVSSAVCRGWIQLKLEICFFFAQVRPHAIRSRWRVSERVSERRKKKTPLFLTIQGRGGGGRRRTVAAVSPPQRENLYASHYNTLKAMP